jgi:hypothetical protein
MDWKYKKVESPKFNELKHTQVADIIERVTKFQLVFLLYNAAAWTHDGGLGVLHMIDGLLAFLLRAISLWTARLDCPNDERQRECLQWLCSGTAEFTGSF